MAKWIFTLCLGLLIGYLLICLSVWFWQRSLIYRPNKEANPPPQALELSRFEVLYLHTADSLPLEAWWARPTSAKQPVIIYFHGNAGNIADRAVTMTRYLEKGFGIFLLEYRGYANNPGKPTEKDFYQDAQTAVNFVLNQGINPQCIVLYGESLGCGVATQMALLNKVGALVLQTPFTSLAAVANVHYPFLPSRFFLREKYDNLLKIPYIHMPLLVLHGDDDSVVPFEQGKAVFDRAHDPKVWHRYAGGEHGDLITQFGADREVIHFIEQYVHC